MLKAEAQRDAMRMRETDWHAVAERVEQVRAVASEFAGALRTHFGPRLRDVRLFGSAARGDWQEGSDVDVLVLLDAVRGPDRDWVAEAATRMGILDSGAIQLVALRFVREGRIPAEAATLLSQLGDAREAADYTAAAHFTEGEARQALDRARGFIAICRPLLNALSE